MWCSVYPVSSQWHLECGKWRWCWLFLLPDTRAGEMRPGAEHSSPDNGYNGSPVRRGDKWMIAGDISSWAEGGASRCHTVTPPAQTSISSGQDFITSIKKSKDFFHFFPSRRRRQWTIPAWSWWCCMTRVFLGYQKTIIKLIFLLALGPLPYFADFLMSHSECWTMGGGEKASLVSTILLMAPCGGWTHRYVTIPHQHCLAKALTALVIRQRTGGGGVMNHHKL